RIKPETPSHAVALGRVYINRDPLDELKRLHASIGWSGAVGYFIPLTDADRKRILECIKFNEGGDNRPTAKGAV
ncbi:MAG TPA: hypothetical protein VM571_00215, partial [Noviherbaspirillum sp.]|nr:hypothetical protein [Noviherbaspirillum sp.]